MFKIICQNTANIITLFRIGFVFVVLCLLSADSVVGRVIGLLVLILATLLDWLDGYIARKLKVISKAGAMLDTLGDRITESCLLIFFAYKHLIPFAVVVIFVTRSFLSDFVRSLNFSKGIGVFNINNSRMGSIFVSSVTSRGLYLLLKIVLFAGGCWVLVISAPDFSPGRAVSSPALKSFVYHVSFLVLAFNLVRFVLLLYNSRNTLKEYFSNDYK